MQFDTRELAPLLALQASHTQHPDQLADRKKQYQRQHEYRTKKINVHGLWGRVKSYMGSKWVSQQGDDALVYGAKRDAFAPWVRNRSDALPGSLTNIRVKKIKGEV